MKISIITVCLNSKETILHTLNSVVSQNYNNTEHIIVDGGSTDGTIQILKKYKNKNKKLIIAKGKSLYASLNLGIQKSSGSLISILHSDDIYNNSKVLTKVARIAKNNKYKLFLGDVVYFKNKNFLNVIRNYPANNISAKNFLYGNMPPHTGSFYKKELFKKYGYYNTNYKIAGDFEHLLRLIVINKVKHKYLNFVVTRMKSGGLSGKNLNSFFIINKEILKSHYTHKINSNLFKILLRVPPKIFQYIFLNQDKINKSFEMEIKDQFLKELYNNLKIIRNIKNLNFKKNFILSALNLAFIGSLSRDKIKLSKELINWPDGVFSKIYKTKLKKIPGRDVLKSLKVGNDIKRIIVLGNLSNNGKNYLINKFKLPILHKSLPFGDYKKIAKSINIKFKKNDLIFLTLPTPKQEQIANYLGQKNKFYKIICIGGSIGIVAGDEKEVPKIFYYLEFLWRLRYETIRRFQRLLTTFYQYVTDIIIYKKIKNINIKLID
tara:strand:- start:3808 stop:5283 length:1476 start_codon:yes stop_codon:yes gene_type:complete